MYIIQIIIRLNYNTIYIIYGMYTLSKLFNHSWDFEYYNDILVGLETV